jgi:transcriptional regulator with XRE-family HTH domain
MNIADTLSKYRGFLGISQGTLAARAKVSLPTVQQLEAGKGNHSVETLRALFSELGLEIYIKPHLADWNFLARCGVPLLPEKKSHERVSREWFLKELRIAFVELDSSAGDPEVDRKRDAIHATLLALMLHYPKVYKEVRRSEYVKQIDFKNLPGRLIKLKRIAVDGLSHFL